MAGQKKVVVRGVSGEVWWGYLAGTGFVVDEQVELMDLEGKVTSLPLNEIETIAYVRDFNLSNSVDPEQIGRRAFVGRPRGEGLWVRVALRSVTPLEGLVAVDGGFLDGLIEDRGFVLTPPDPRSNAVRVFIPRRAVRELEVLGWVSSTKKKVAEKAARQIEMAVQAGLFEG